MREGYKFTKIFIV